MGGIGPMFGQHHYLASCAPEKIAYEIERYGNEINRLHWMLETRIKESEYLAGGHDSSADIATFPWVRNPDPRVIDQGSTSPSPLRSGGGTTRSRHVPPSCMGSRCWADQQRPGAMTDAERENLFGARQFAAH